MSASTGPVVAAGLITIFNATIVQGKGVGDARVVPILVGTGIVAATLSVMENVLPGTATAAGWLILGAVILVRTDPAIPSPAEAIAAWYTTGQTTRRSGGGSF